MQTLSVVEPAHRTPAASILFGLGELGRAVGHRLSKSDIDGGTLHLLHLLHRLGPARVTELATESRLDTSTVSRHVQSLERRGYVLRMPDPHDGRAHRLALSDDGRAALEEMTRASLAALEVVLADWPEDDVASFSRHLTRLIDGLQTDVPDRRAGTQASNPQR